MCVKFFRCSGGWRFTYYAVLACASAPNRIAFLCLAIYYTLVCNWGEPHEPEPYSFNFSTRTRVHLQEPSILIKSTDMNCFVDLFKWRGASLCAACRLISFLRVFKCDRVNRKGRSRACSFNKHNSEAFVNYGIFAA